MKTGAEYMKDYRARGKAKGLRQRIFWLDKATIEAMEALKANLNVDKDVVLKHAITLLYYTIILRGAKLSDVRRAIRKWQKKVSGRS